MNGLSSECDSYSQSDLVFIMSGGAYQEKALPIKTQKCILAFDGNNGSAQQTRCAIFRGDAGVTVRNLDNRVLVNGKVRQEHWLQLGDRIEFPNSIVLEVSQLGCTGAFETGLSPAVEAFETTPSNHDLGAYESVGSSSEFSSAGSDAESSFEAVSALPDRTSRLEESPSTPELSSDALSCVESRFHEIEERLNQLADQISSLVTLASCGRLSSTAMPESDWEKQVNNSSALNTFSPSISLSPEEHLSNEPSVAPLAEPTAATSRFNVADFGAAAESSETGSAPNETSLLEVDTKFITERPAAENHDSLVLTRRLPEAGNPTIEEPNNVFSQTSAMPAQSSSAGLFELMESLVENESNLTPQPATNSGETASSSSTFDVAAKFSPLGEVASAQKTPTSPESLPTAAPIPSKESVSKPTSVDEEIDALLSRLFNGQPNTPSTSSTSGTTDQSPEVSQQSTMATEDVISESNPLSSPALDAHISSPVTGAESSYVNMNFGYDLSATDTSEVDANKTMIAVADSSESETEQAVAERVEPESQAAISESASDLLARLLQDGCWDASGNASKSTSDVGRSDEHQVPTKTSPAQEAEARSAESINTETNATFSNAETVTTAPHPAASAPDSVEDYMNQLLARMHVGLESPSESFSKEQKNVANAKLAQAALEDPEKNSELMTAEEYVPLQKGAKLESLETMREIANSTARSAVAYSDLDRRKARGLMQAFIGFGAFIMAAYYFLFVSESFADTAFFVGSICLLIAGGASYLAFRTFKGTGVLNDLFPQRK